MLVLSGVCNTRILDIMNYMNQVYVHANYTLIFIYSCSMLYLPAANQKTSHVFAWIWPNSDPVILQVLTLVTRPTIVPNTTNNSVAIFCSVPGFVHSQMPC
jgi:hypothetical protein